MQSMLGLRNLAPQIHYIIGGRGCGTCQVIVLGDRKMPTEENQLAWLRLGVGYIGPVTMQDHHRQTLRLYIHSSALAKQAAKRRQDEMAAIEAEIQRIQGLVNKYPMVRSF